jgi:hypothetical protein
MSFPNEVKIGLDRPAQLERQMEIYGDVREMRKAIIRGQRDSSLIAACLRMAEANGLSDEEMYISLAYHALCQLEVLWQQNVKLFALDPRKPFIKPE